MDWSFESINGKIAEGAFFLLNKSFKQILERDEKQRRTLKTAPPLKEGCWTFGWETGDAPLPSAGGGLNHSSTSDLNKVSKRLCVLNSL